VYKVYARSVDVCKPLWIGIVASYFSERTCVTKVVTRRNSRIPFSSVLAEEMLAIATKSEMQRELERFW
jgi:hypothetical protein